MREELGGNSDNRDRAWRRHKQEAKTKSRIVRILKRHGWWRFIDANGIKLDRPQWYDFIGTESEFTFKTLVTTRYDSRYKTKWGKKGKRNYDYSSDPFTRVKDKVRFQKLLKEELSESI